MLPNSLTPVYRAFEFTLSKPHIFPLEVSEVAAIASSRFHAKDVAKDLLKDLAKYKPSDAKIESVQQSILLRRIADRVSDQLASGKYNLTEIGNYANHVSSFGASALVRNVAPVEQVKKEVSKINYITGIDAIDTVLGGIQDELIVVSARPKNGKSNFFINLIQRAPKKKFLYVVICDYGFASLCQAMYDCDPHILDRGEMVKIADFNSFTATAVDVDSAVTEYKPDVVIVDRAEEMPSLVKNKDERQDLKIIFKAMRQLAKKHHIPVFVDAQQSEAGEQFMKQYGWVSPDHMAGDRTGRLATLDLFLGLQRKQGHTKIHMFGRRKTLPANIEVKTNPMGRYL